MSEAAGCEVPDADDHAPLWVERHVDEAETAVEGSRGVVDRVGDDAEASDIEGEPQAGLDCVLEQRAGVSPGLVAAIDGELSDEDRGNGVGSVTLVGFGEKFALDLRCAEGDVCDDLARGGVTQDAGP